MAEQENSNPGRQLFIDFLEDFLQISFIGFSPDRTLILFRGPNGSELSVPASTMYEPREQARQVIRAKIAASEKEAAMKTDVNFKVVIRKQEYPRKRTGFSVWVKNTSDDSQRWGFCAHPETDEATAEVVAAAMELLVATEEGRAMVSENI